jgi:hypothetical protein
MQKITAAYRGSRIRKLHATPAHWLSGWRARQGPPPHRSEAQQRGREEARRREEEARKRAEAEAKARAEAEAKARAEAEERARKEKERRAAERKKKIEEWMAKYTDIPTLLKQPDDVVQALPTHRRLSACIMRQLRQTAEAARRTSARSGRRCEAQRSSSNRGQSGRRAAGPDPSLDNNPSDRRGGAYPPPDGMMMPVRVVHPAARSRQPSERHHRGPVAARSIQYPAPAGQAAPRALATRGC